MRRAYKPIKTLTKKLAHTLSLLLVIDDDCHQEVIDSLILLFVHERKLIAVDQVKKVNKSFQSSLIQSLNHFSIWVLYMVTRLNISLNDHPFGIFYFFSITFVVYLSVIVLFVSCHFIVVFVSFECVLVSFAWSMFAFSNDAFFTHQGTFLFDQTNVLFITVKLRKVSLGIHIA